MDFLNDVVQPKAYMFELNMVQFVSTNSNRSSWLEFQDIVSDILHFTSRNLA